MSEVAKVKQARAKVSGLWAGTTESGTTYWSGKTEEGVRFTVYPNGFKTAENHPDMILYTELPDPEGTIEKNSRAVLAVTELKAPVKKM